MTQDWDLTMRMVLQRREAYLSEHYIGLHFTVVSLALGTAGVTAALLLAAGTLPADYAVLFGFLWATTVLATITAFGAATVGSVLLPSRLPSISDLVLPLLIAICEFLLFAILAPQAGSDTAPRRAVITWYFLMAAFCALAAVAIARVGVIFRSARYSPDIRAHMHWYRRQLRLDALGATTTASLSLAAGFLHLGASQVPAWVSCGITTIIAALLVLASLGHGRVSNYWQAALDGHLGR
ncbi:hypothetical protein [Glycomyces terrestris]|uniref:Uncharacterized protein n=1 Tax=Glycomyces terrestris TaxID=2493553 RepID=A0A426UW32_9ACTN|nr:hypothetical protein [Glycomyces terrestris]RRR98537.1 hypothetical protein EIW28_16815 [Glycomyces terrestris]